MGKPCILLEEKKREVQGREQDRRRNKWETGIKIIKGEEKKTKEEG